MSNEPLHFLDLPRPNLEYGILQGQTDTTTLAAHDFDVDPRTGFMPHQPPLTRLPDKWELWESALDAVLTHPFIVGDSLAITTADLERSEVWRQRIEKMPILDTVDFISSEPLLRRAHLVLAFLLHIYVHSHSKDPNSSSTIIPCAIGIPLLRVSASLQLPPVLTYADTVLYNWAPIDPSLPVSEQNIRVVTTASGTPDECHFYLTSSRIELRGVEALDLMRASLDEAFIGDEIAIRRISGYLDKLAMVIHDLTSTLHAVRQGCDPSVFYNVVRPWFRGVDSGPNPTNQWLFQDAEKFGFLQPIEMSGPSAGQSSLIYALDIFLSVDEKTHAVMSHSETHEKPFLERMKAYMPRHHRAFLTHLAAEPRRIRDLVQTSHNEGFTQAYNSAIQALKIFRDGHIQIVTSYIISQARSTPSNLLATETHGSNLKGTGGTELVPFLKGVRDRTARSALDRVSDKDSNPA
ncbi:Indoleamine 2,3-dioxygenase [Sistotremastrum niveocremeum HHB9708]|uniref:Indoleamine 2,3-dioxygenase n=2 Tax=Sistotremastraceae TaxID=3402574 RepID=A0A164V985_9AGAM|nr:Indoleamine 2,3-dioxygenase [Sistotremastrum niveocremeum HHB9708]KZT42432.1 Indoleamine 2,3-dioxygenase [Sistotremastrum suecicum HHB10207 ss-3]